MLANLGVLIRVLADALVADPMVAASAVLLSGITAGAALLLFVALTVRTLRRGGLPIV